jgi:hypothetical protein
MFVCKCAVALKTLSITSETSTNHSNLMSVIFAQITDPFSNRLSPHRSGRQSSGVCRLPNSYCS